MRAHQRQSRGIHSRAATFLIFGILLSAAQLAGLPDYQNNTILYPPQDMWDCNSRQTFIDRPVGEVQQIDLGPQKLTVLLEQGGGRQGFSFAGTVKVVTAAERHDYVYQIHDQAMLVGEYNLQTGQTITNTSLVSYTTDIAGQGVLTIQYDQAFGEEVSAYLEQTGDNLVAAPLNGLIPPPELAGKGIYVQVNTFVQPVETDTRACGQFAGYYIDAQTYQTERADGLNDGLLCPSGVGPYALPEQVDITKTWVDVDLVTQVYQFNIELGRVTTVTDRLAGGIEFYNPAGPRLEEYPDWYFNTTGNLSYNFLYNTSVPIETSVYAVTGSAWEPVETYVFTATVEANIVHIDIPIAEIPPEAKTWMATVTNFSVCDEAGLGENQLADIPLPPPEEPTSLDTPESPTPIPETSAVITTTVPTDLPTEEDTLVPIPTESLDEATPVGETTDGTEEEPSLWSSLSFFWQIALILIFILLIAGHTFLMRLETPFMSTPQSTPPSKTFSDPRNFNPYKDEFPLTPEIPGALEWKLDVIITKLHDIGEALNWGFGCLIPLLIGILALLGVAANFFVPWQAGVFAVFAYLLYWLLQFLVRRFIGRWKL